MRLLLVRESDKPVEKVVIRSPEDVAKQFEELKEALQEELWIMSLNTAGAVNENYMVSKGGIAASIVEPQTIFRWALLTGAASIILVHNHPSGNVEPSADDLAVTRQVSEAGRIIGIPLKDHVIVTRDGFTSLAERGAV